jgi:hypothetical protein
MFDHIDFESPASVIGIDVRFSNISGQELFAIRTYLTERLKLADLSSAEWYWVRYPDISHVVAMHEVIDIPDALWWEIGEMVYEIGVEAAAVARVLFDSSAKCEGMELYYPEQVIKHSPANMRRI